MPFRNRQYSCPRAIKDDEISAWPRFGSKWIDLLKPEFLAGFVSCLAGGFISFFSPVNSCCPLKTEDNNVTIIRQDDSIKKVFAGFIYWMFEDYRKNS